MIITAGKFKGRKISAPDENITRPTLSKVRMSVFNTLQSLIDFEGSSFLDMFAGSGIMGLEALSRGFTRVVEIEKNPKSAKILKENISKIAPTLPSPMGMVSEKQEGVDIFIGDSLNILPKSDEKFDVIYIDPPYFSGIYEQSLDTIKNTARNIVILEHVTDVDFGDFEIIKQKKYGDKYLTFLKTPQQKLF